MQFDEKDVETMCFWPDDPSASQNARMAILVRHKPTGLEASSWASNSQVENRIAAVQRLREMVEQGR
jgi:hypothetical protein